MRVQIPGGGAGIQADLKTFFALGIYGSSVITALTAQNGLGVNGIFPSSPEFVTLQLKTVMEGFPIKAAKTGMLFSSDIIKAVAESLKAKNFILLIDPVCVSQSGHKLMKDEAIQTLIRELIPLADILTPNRPEAETLSGIKLNSTKDIKETCKILTDMGAKAVLIKGGHFESDKQVTDWFAVGDSEPEPLHQPKIITANNHGTGCTLGAAITANLALGFSLKESVILAQKYLNYCLRYSYNPGKGHGPVNHAAWLYNSMD